MSPERKIYLVTGCSAGLGYCLCKAILAAGHGLIATSRSPSKTPEKVAEIESLGGKWAQLDVTSPSVSQQFADAVKIYGRVDVLVNNAGIAMAATIEDADLDGVRRVYETNVFGLMRMCQLAVPLMRAQLPSGGGGTIVNVSSAGAFFCVPMVWAYHSSKAAVDVFTESLRNEVAPFGIRVLMAQPGGIRTGFVGNSSKTEMSEAYKGTPAEYVLDALTKGAGSERIDPEKCALRIVEAVDGTGMMEGVEELGFRIPLGSEAVALIQGRVEELTSTLKKHEKTSLSVDYEE
ncbi:uncharacterized protein E0L32_000469 [Thyridium curvatum]|uniref:Uncharacterized protein n=1 Tax=Thyridium curvatum TaxID=1093900 RepID=A0A507ATD5_9PEZI|nr:uncharacterized protein E0L32_000469 [Thyridium curvatum]TPX14075.1 hypothetical protein E0L32_000469 [Thyridium curvatum]